MMHGLKKAMLVVGSDGSIGHPLSKYLLSVGENFIETSRRKNQLSEKRIWLDLSQDITSWDPPHNISVAYLCAAITSLDCCRKNPLQSSVVNLKNIVLLAEKLMSSGARVIFLSTDRVFDGSAPFRETGHPVSPKSAYGRQKADAEAALLALGKQVLVLRLTKVLGPGTHPFSEWLEALKKKEVIYPFKDMVMAPIALSSVVSVLYRLAKPRLSGILQASGEEDITYAQAAYYMARQLGVDQDLVQPIEAQSSGMCFESLPHHSTLDTTRLQEALGIPSFDVWTALDSLLHDEN